MKNYSNGKLPRAHHLDEQKRVVTVFHPTGKNTVKLVQECAKAYPAHMVVFTKDFKDLERLHGQDENTEG
jgi:hypothetical protein